MYVPPHFRENDVATLQDAIRRYPLATLATVHDGELAANHLPMLLDPDDGAFGTLVFHVARANPVWRGAGGDALAIFAGPDAYVTPSYYPSKRVDGKVVPTWNYVAVHAYGALEAFDDAERLHALVSRLTAVHEGSRDAPWAVDDAPESFVDGQLRGIVGLRMPIRRLIGKWKMSQNRPPGDRAGVADGLDARAGANERATAEVVRERDRQLRRE